MRGCQNRPGARKRRAKGWRKKGKERRQKGAAERLERSKKLDAISNV
jgi:hypothetical protein